MIGYIFITIGLIIVAYAIGHLFGYAEAKYDEREKRGTS
jgi:hypothetical protein